MVLQDLHNAGANRSKTSKTKAQGGGGHDILRNSVCQGVSGFGGGLQRDFAAVLLRAQGVGAGAQAGGTGGGGFASNLGQGGIAHQQRQFFGGQQGRGHRIQNGPPRRGAWGGAPPRGGPDGRSPSQSGWPARLGSVRGENPKRGT